MRRPSLRAALRQEVRRAVARQGAAISRRLDRARVRLRSLRATVRKQSAELARAQRRIERLRIQGARRAAAQPSGPALTPAQIRAARGAQSRRAFAEQLGVSANSIFLWETGRANPRGSNLARLDKARSGKRGTGRPRKAKPANGRRRKKTA